MAGSYTYDAAGNTASIAGVPLYYNQHGRLTSLNVNNVQIDYLYNALDQMIVKSVEGVTTVLAYDEAGHLLGEYSPTTGLIQETVWMGDTPVATIQPTTGGSGFTLYYVHTDFKTHTVPGTLSTTCVSRGSTTRPRPESFRITTEIISPALADIWRAIPLDSRAGVFRRMHMQSGILLH